MKKLLLIVLLGISTFSSSALAVTNTQNVQNFVSRFYTEVLGRTADQAGLDDWTNRLVSGESAGSDVATGFIFSAEFSNRNTNNTLFLNTLYKAFFNRDADNGGFSIWFDKLNQGTSREDVLNGFLYSEEFANLANAYGIKPVPDGSTPSSSGTGVEDFVKRFYSVVLGREADAGGLADWVNRLNTKVATGADIATGFVFSPEFDESSKDNVTLLNLLYKAFFNREADAGGLSGWLTQLEQGTSREDVLNGFLYSQEFVNLCDKYGIIAYIDTPVVVDNTIDRLVVSKINNNEFSLHWVKNEGGYGEVIYTDDLSKDRGNGYPFTSNSTGEDDMVCKNGDGSYGYTETDTVIYYKCNRINITYNDYPSKVRLEKGVEYKWLVSSGFNHVKGEVEATMIYRDGNLYIE